MNNYLIFRELSNAKNENQLIGVYTDKENPDKFNVGYVIYYNNNFLILKSVDEEGNVDEIIIYPIETIYLIEINSNYLSKLQQEKSIRREDKVLNFFEKNVLNDWGDLLHFLFKNQKIIKIKHLYDFPLTGKIVDADDRYLKMRILNQEITLREEADGEVIIKKEHINHIYLPIK